MTDKLRKKIERQQRRQDKLFGNYTLGVKKAKQPKFSQNKLWSYNNIDQRNEFEIVVGGKLYKKVVR